MSPLCSIHLVAVLACSVAYLSPSSAVAQERGAGSFVCGFVLYDLDQDGIMDFDTDQPAVAFPVQISPGSNVVVTDEFGYYCYVENDTEVNEVELSPYVLPLSAEAVSPSSHLRTMEPGGVDSANFLLTPAGDYQDLGVTLHLSNSPVPGQSRMLTARVRNNGCYPMVGTVQLKRAPQWNWNGAQIPMGTVDGDLVTWSVPLLEPGETAQFKAPVILATSTPIGTIVRDSALVVAPTPDVYPFNNRATTNATTLNSYDPNDKQAFPSMLTPEEGLLGTKVDYLIRFQNTGTAPALEVVITDTLDSRLLYGPLEFVSASHPCLWSMTNGVLRFEFPGINLPDSGSSMAASQGFVVIRTDVQPGLLPGDTIPNRANIYFDFNEPIITETSWVTVESTSAIYEAYLPVGKVTPNPASDALTVELPETIELPAHVQFVSEQGLVVLTRTLTQQRSIVPVSRLARGIYFMHVAGTDQATKVILE